MRRQTREGPEIEFVSAVIRVSEDANILHEETPTYSMTNLLSDIGGALGLCLGLCIWQMVHSVMQAVVMVVNKAANLSNRITFTKTKFLTKKKIGRKSRHLTTPSIRKQPLDSTGTISPISRDESRNSLVPGVKTRANEVNDNEKSLYLFSV